MYAWENPGQNKISLLDFVIPGESTPKFWPGFGPSFESKQAAKLEEKNSKVFLEINSQSGN